MKTEARNQALKYCVISHHITSHINKNFDLYCEVCMKIAQLRDNTTCLIILPLGCRIECEYTCHRQSSHAILMSRR